MSIPYIFIVFLIVREKVLNRSFNFVNKNLKNK